MTTSPRADAGPRSGWRGALVAAVMIAAVAGWAVPVLADPARPVAAAAGAAAGEAGQEQPDESTTTSVTAPPDQDIIPEPDSGTPPTEAGDRGGALQLALLALILAGVGLIAWRVVVSARRHEARSGSPPPAS